MTTKFKQSTGSKFNHSHMIIPSEDTTWAISQKPSVLRFWQQCWLADPYGSRWMKLVTNLSDSAFRLARRVLEATGLFIFRRLSCGSDGRTSVWEVKNLHGARVKDFWQSEKNEADTASNKADNILIKANTATNETGIATPSQSEQAFSEPSRTSQKHLTNSSKEIVRCDSSTSYENSRDQETAIAPFRGASPQALESVEEEEKELPAVTDCTSLALVDAVQGQSALLLGEKQDCRVEPIIPHVRAASRREGTFSAAPVAPNFEEQAQHSLSTSLTDENQISRNESETLHVGHSSAAPAPSDEKWSHEAIAIRSKMRPLRMEKLKTAKILGEKPDFEFLAECWNDDPALQIVIKKLLAKFRQWGIACVDGVLVKWEESDG